MARNVSDKIRTIDELQRTLTDLKQQGKKVVQCHGVFDLVHLGHIRHFSEAKRQGDILVVTLTRDKYVRRGPGRPVFNENLRAEALAALEVVDYVGIDDSPTAVDCIRRLKPDVYAKGPDYREKGKDITGKIYEEEEAIRSVGGRLAITEDITFSSSQLLNQHFNGYPPATRDYLKTLSEKYTADEITDRLHSTERLKVLVLGDAIVDQYHYCVPMGRSSKEPLVVNRYVSAESFAGGTLATANHAAALCGNVDLLTVLGRPRSFEDFIRGKLNPNVKPVFFYRDDVGTIVKRRYVAHGVSRKLFEICFMDDGQIPASVEADILRHLEKTVAEYDLVIVSDFGHDLMTSRIIDLVCRNARYLAINVQTNSANIGFNVVTKYPRANCVCVDEAELRYATRDKFGDLRTHARQVYDQLHCEHLITTRGSNGSLSYTKSGGFLEAPALAYQVVDAVGAGDAFFAFVAPCAAAGFPQDLISFIGNAVGSLAVQIVCNREPVSLVDLIKFITRLLK
jgi:rfaE bifunctional protein nucleotidyltransferase chain/domain